MPHPWPDPGPPSLLSSGPRADLHLGLCPDPLGPLSPMGHSKTFCHHLPAIISFCHCEWGQPLEGMQP